MSHLVLHAPEGRYLCVEPVTHVCDGANLADAGMPGTGIKRLAPGETLQAQADFIIVPDDAG
jgi:aldose 1-epimerase